MANDWFGKPPPPITKPAFSTSSSPSSPNSPHKPEQRPLNNHNGSGGWRPSETPLSQPKLK
jgi:hypothetical protein